MGYEEDLAAEEAVRRAFAVALVAVGDETAAIVRGLAPKVTGGYRRTIGSSTYLGGKLLSGKSLRNMNVVPKADVQTVVYSSSPTSWLLEFGTAEHRVASKKGAPFIIDPVYDFFAPLPFLHPGSRKFPHFMPGAVAAIHRIGPSIAAHMARKGR